MMNISKFSVVTVCILSFANNIKGQNVHTTSLKKYKEEVVYTSEYKPGLRLALYHVWPASGKIDTNKIILFLHGGAVPISGNMGFKINGISWMTAMAEKGYDTWGLDFAGYGNSGRFSESDSLNENGMPQGTVAERSKQTNIAVHFIKDKRHVNSIHLLGNSGGSIVAGLYTTEFPSNIKKLVLHGPITNETKAADTTAKPAAYDYVNPAELVDVFCNWRPAGYEPVINRKYLLDYFVPQYLNSDPTSGGRNPATVKIPGGVTADLVDIAKGKFPYNPEKITTPTLITRGEWDAIATDKGGMWLFTSLRNAPCRRYIIIGNGTHTVQLEKERFRLFKVVEDFLEEK